MTTSTSTSTTTYRYPFDPFPDGWYLLVESVDLPPGAVVPLRYFGRDLVAFRTEGGTASVVDAHCPHMGAHLGYGGKVVEESIQCPFHAWRFDACGQCVDVPYSTAAKPPRVGVGTYPTLDANGAVMVWFSSAGTEPPWQPSIRPEFGAPGWHGYYTYRWTIRMHVQELAENIPDAAHFTYVHNAGINPLFEASVDGHIYRQSSVAELNGVRREFTYQEAEGLGLVWLRSLDGDLPNWLLTATTPIDEETCDLRVLFLVQGSSPDGLTPAEKNMLELVADNVARDVPIWEHKVYREKPPLVPGDGPINLLRKWATQFYPANS